MKRVLFSISIVFALAVMCLAVEKAPLPLVADAHASSIMYHGNKKSHVFHRSGCRYYNCKNCLVLFSSRKQAL